MTIRQCSRCGRIDDANNVIDEALPLPPAPGRDAGAANRVLWTTINNETVCPECQTESERRDATRRVVTAIEEHVARSTAVGTEPLPIEAGIVPYAMTLREQERKSVV
jgi:hypothetical protein